MRAEGTEWDNPEAGWVGQGAARIEAEMKRLKSGEKLEAWVGGIGAIACEPEEGRGERWTCPLEAGWATVEPGVQAVEVRLKPGEAAELTRLYRVDTQVPQLHFQLSELSSLRVRVCAQAEDTQSGMLRVQTTAPVVMLGEQKMEVAWGRCKAKW